MALKSQNLLEVREKKNLPPLTRLKKGEQDFVEFFSKETQNLFKVRQKVNICNLLLDQEKASKILLNFFLRKYKVMSLKNF